MGKDIRKPTVHNMKRRSHSHDYSRSGYYHITISTAKTLYHPSAQRMDDCASGRLLLVTPWHYQLRSRTENITTLVCKTMNCIAQAICRQKDDWWKKPNKLEL